MTDIRAKTISVIFCMAMVSFGAGIQWGMGAGMMALGVMFFAALLLHEVHEAKRLMKGERQ
jgi:hypothetical protein